MGIVLLRMIKEAQALLDLEQSLVSCSELGKILLERRKKFLDEVNSGVYPWIDTLQTRRVLASPNLEELAEIILRVSHQSQQLRDNSDLRTRLGNANDRNVIEMGLLSERGMFWGHHQVLGDVKVVESLGSFFSLPSSLTDQQFLKTWSVMMNDFLKKNTISNQLQSLNANGEKYGAGSDFGFIYDDIDNIIAPMGSKLFDFRLAVLNNELPSIRLNYKKDYTLRTVRIQFGIEESNTLGRDY
jgi:hypothetical protein